jgi:lantibiotic transport system ATP-binding protein
MNQSEAFYRALLNLYPDAVRAEFGDLMLLHFSDLCREAESGGWLAKLRLWWIMLLDVLNTAPREHLAEIACRGNPDSETTSSLRDSEESEGDVRMEYAIESEQLLRRFGEQIAVDGISLRVPAGSVYGFLGPNGAGKTTTIRMLLGLIQPNQGRIRLLGEDLKSNGHALARIGAMVEGPSLYPNLTGRENIEVTRRLLGVNRQRLDEVLTIVGLSDAADKLVSKYSQGMKQRLGIALALLNEPELLILDEPTNGLDPAGIRGIRELIRELPGRYGLTVFLSSHLLSEIEQVATHVGIIHRGRLIYQDTMAALEHERREQVKLGVFDAERAIALLERSGYRVERAQSYLKVDTRGQQEAARLNRSLIQQDQEVFHLALEQLSLEDIFLRLTGEVFDHDRLDTRAAS